MQLPQKIAAVAAAATAGLAARDLTQKKHSILRNYPVAGHLRYAVLLQSWGSRKTGVE